MLARIERLRAWRGWGIGACVVAGACLLASGGPRWESDLAALSPVPRTALALDSELRNELGAPDPVSIALVQGDTAEAVLRKEESLLPMLDMLTAQGVVGGVEIAARYLPSAATQLGRRSTYRSLTNSRCALRRHRTGCHFAPAPFGRSSTMSPPVEPCRPCCCRTSATG